MRKEKKELLMDGMKKSRAMGRHASYIQGEFREQ
jgi:hypothetical protein